MELICLRKKSQYSKCIPFVIVGAIFLFIGIPLMIAGIIGGFQYSDLIGYIGGAASFFGVLFLFVWYVVTIPNMEKMKSALVNAEAEITKSRKNSKLGHNNPAFMAESNEPKHLLFRSKSEDKRQSFSSCSSSEKDQSPERNPLEQRMSDYNSSTFVSETGSTVLLISPAPESDLTCVDGSNKSESVKNHPETTLERISETSETNSDQEMLRRSTNEQQTHKTNEEQQSNNSNNVNFLTKDIFARSQNTFAVPEVKIASVSCTSVPYTNPLSSLTW